MLEEEKKKQLCFYFCFRMFSKANICDPTTQFYLSIQLDIIMKIEKSIIWIPFLVFSYVISSLTILLQFIYTRMDLIDFWSCSINSRIDSIDFWSCSINSRIDSNRINCGWIFLNRCDEKIRNCVFFSFFFLIFLFEKFYLCKKLFFISGRLFGNFFFYLKFDRQIQSYEFKVYHWYKRDVQSFLFSMRFDDKYYWRRETI